MNITQLPSLEVELWPGVPWAEGSIPDYEQKAHNLQKKISSPERELRVPLPGLTGLELRLFHATSNQPGLIFILDRRAGAAKHLRLAVYQEKYLYDSNRKDYEPVIDKRATLSDFGISRVIAREDVSAGRLNFREEEGWLVLSSEEMRRIESPSSAYYPFWKETLLINKATLEARFVSRLRMDTGE